ncbi:hypothetical protein [uncultured Psychrobacter sp.]|uniref:hypothetical protein n=1 Tax=uncultured Psychrobacter sp. TaxID=259303 RepID=UPI00345A5307
MALINCPECSKRVSDQSVACPNCGFPITKLSPFRAVPPPLPKEDSINSEADLLVRKPQVRKPQKKAKSSKLPDFFAALFIIFLIYQLATCSDDETQVSSQVEDSLQVQDLLVDSELTQIPMLLSGSGEDGRYFLISHFTSYGLENIAYVRRGNESDTYGSMQIDCLENEMRKSSSGNLEALKTAKMGDWVTPAPDWTDQDIVNFICEKQSVPEQSQLNTERNAVEEPVLTSETFVSIPMSDSFENGRYFLTSHTIDNGVENIEYIREGNDNTSYAKMEIKCSENQIRIYSADNFDALQSANMGDWFTPTPDWTDQDIVNFICSK